MELLHGHFGYANILETEIKGSREINETNISESLMRFSENNDCVFINIFNGIKDYKGYKNYSIDRIKNEFINLGIDITNGVCFNDIKKWIGDNKLHISCYLFAPDFILKDSIKGFRNSNIKIPHLIFMYNNNHCYLINDEEIKNKIIYGKREDISDLNPVSNYKFDSFKNYFKRHFITLKEIIEKGDLDKIEDDVILCEMDESFLKLIHFLVGIDNTQINFIDYKKECILFKGKIIFKVSDYSKRKEICAKLNEIYGVVNFNFENDHYSSIGMKMFKLLNGEIPKSYYNNEVRGLIDNYYIEPCHFGSDNYSELYKNYKYKIGGDCPKSYSNGIYNNFKGVKIPVLSVFDNFIKKDFIINEIHTNLLYLIDCVVYKGIKYTDISLCPYFIVKKLLEKGVIVKCLGYIKCSKYYDGTKLCNFVSECYNLLEPKDAKNIVNCVAGLFNKKWKNDNKGFITKDHDIVNNALLEGYDISWEGDEDRIYVAKWKGIERINGDYNLIHQSIIWGGVLNLFELIDKVDIEYKDYKIVGCNTDAIYFLSNDLVEFKNNGGFYDKTFKISEEEYREKHLREKESRDFIYEKRNWKLSDNGSYLFDFEGGTGKSYKAVFENKDKKILCLSFENNAVENLRNYCKKFGVEEYEGRTIHSSLGLDINETEGDRKGINLNNYEVIILDELFRTDPWLLSKLYFELLKFKGKLILIGHGTQIKYISNENYRYNKCDCIGELVGFNYFKFSNKEINEKLDSGKIRYDRETFKMLRHFQRYNNLNGYKFNGIDKKLKTNLVLLNKTKDLINSRFSNGLKIGDKARLNEHYEKLGFFKGYKFIVENIEGDLVNGLFKISDIELNYGETAHKVQGTTIYEKYNIMNLGRMTKERLYTCLSRATKMEDIHLNMSELKKEYKSEYDGLIFNEIENNNIKGEIYLVECGITGYFYIGMTLRNKDIRSKEHNTDEKSVVFQMMKEPKFNLIGSVIGTEKMVRKYERDYIIHYKNLYGDNCINKTNFREDEVKINGWCILDKNENIPIIYK